MSRICMSPFYFFNRRHVHSRLVVIPDLQPQSAPRLPLSPLLWFLFVSAWPFVHLQTVIVLFCLTLEFGTVLRALSLRRLIRIRSLCLLR